MKGHLFARYEIILPISQESFTYHKHIITLLLLLVYRILENAVQELNSCILQAGWIHQT